MKKFLLLGLLLGIFIFNACKNDDEATEPDYQITIESPDATDKTVGDTLAIHVHFEDKNGGTVHHINVRVYNKDDGTEIYNKPDEPHVHTEISYSYEDELVLNVDPDTHWVLEAKVWGHDDGVLEVTESVEFHVVN